MGIDVMKLKVFKFGGASVNSAEAVRNMSWIVRRHHDGPLLVVVSAMGKTTNALEKLVPTSPDLQSSKNTLDTFNQMADYHWSIVRELGIEPRVGEKLQRLLDGLRGEIDRIVHSETCSDSCYGCNYDRIVSYGELMSTTIVSAYLESIGIANEWVDVREVIHTDGTHREGRVDWQLTTDAAKRKLLPLLDKQMQGDKGNDGNSPLVVTQGFIAGGSDGTTTLGREGSDYSAAILSYCLDAAAMTIWKDVDGFLDADPKYFADTRRIARIPYNEAIELAYYGASVIHPKTVKPLQNKGIPLYIKSFLKPDGEGSTVGPYDAIEPQTPLYIVKGDQVLMSIMPKDFSFIAEDNLQRIFGVLATVGVRVNMMQNSALSFSVCVDDNELLLDNLRQQLGGSYRLRYNRGLRLITVRYYNEEVVNRVVAGRRILLQQRSRNTVQLLVS